MSLSEASAVSCSRVSSDRQDVELSIWGQQRAIRKWAHRNGYMLIGEYVDEAQSGRVDSRRGFAKMIRNACSAKASFRTIQVWKHDRFSRRIEHAVVYKARLRVLSRPNCELFGGRSGYKEFGWVDYDLLTTWKVCHRAL